jgi:hypothetical protein
MGLLNALYNHFSMKAPSASALPQFVQNLRSARAFRHARIEKRGKIQGSSRLIIGIGQQHGVGHGRFERFQARRIARVQAWIFEACRWFSSQGVHAFGQEGLSRPGKEAFYGRLPPEALSELQEAIRHPEGIRRYLRKTSLQWRKALRRGDAREVRRTLEGLNALNLLQALHAHVVVFPIEQRDVHGPLAQQITQLQTEIDAIERTKAYQSASSKRGKGLTQPEYDAIVRRNAVIAKYNGVLNHDVRNEAIFEEVLHEAQRSDITVFVLGQGHRSAILRLAQEHLPSRMFFLWITPSPLWKPVLVRRIAYCIVAIVIGYALWRFL